MELGTNIKYLRTQRNMTQEELGELLGTTSKSISRWEQGLTYPDITILPYIANVFEITVDKLLGVESIKQDEYVKELKKKANEYAKNNDYNNELKLWQDAYKKLPNNEEIKLCLINIMNIINIIYNDVKYKDEIIKLSESLLEKSTNNEIRNSTTQILVELYSQLGNCDMAELYCKQLPSNVLLTSNVMKTRFLKDDNLHKCIQLNISDFFEEVVRESEFIIYNNRINVSNEYKKEYLDRLIRIEELLYVKDNDYGYSAMTNIFNYIELMKLEVITTNNQGYIVEYLSKIGCAIDYILKFEPHIMKSPFMNKIKCTHLGSYSNVQNDLKENIINGLTNKLFEQYFEYEEYKKILEKIELIK